MNNDKRLYDVTPEPFISGIFAVLQEFDVPWSDEGIAQELDLEYYGNISGNKIVSPLIDRITSGDNLTAAQMADLASIIFHLNKNNWDHEWSMFDNMEYNPIQNYDMVEEMTNDNTEVTYGKIDTRQDNLTHKKTGTETEAPNLTTNTDNAARGFNSAVDVPTTSSDEHTTGTQTTTFNTTDADTGTQTDTLSGKDTTKHGYHLTRSGNIGVTTTQQMIQSDRDLWMWNFFYTVVFPAVDRVLTIETY